MEQQQVATPSDATPGSEPRSLDDRIAEKFGLNETEEAPQQEPEATPAEGTGEEAPEGEPTDEAPSPEEFDWEIKHNGEIKRVTSREEATRLMQQGYDYDFKMQRVNGDQQRINAWAQAVQAQAAMQAQAFDALVEVKSLGHQLQAFANVDWVAESSADPVLAFQKRMQYDGLVNRYNQAVQQAQGLMQPLADASQQIDDNRKALERGKLLDRFPEWKDEARFSKDRESMFGALVKDYGFAKEEISGPLLSDHRVISIIRDAWKYRQANANAKAGKGNQGTPKTLQPGPKPQARSRQQELGDIKKAMRQTTDPQKRKELGDRLLSVKFGL